MYNDSKRAKNLLQNMLPSLSPLPCSLFSLNFIAGRANTLLINLFKNMKKQITWAMINKKKTSKIEVVVAIIAILTALFLMGTPNL